MRCRCPICGCIENHPCIRTEIEKIICKCKVCQQDFEALPTNDIINEFNG